MEQSLLERFTANINDVMDKYDIPVTQAGIEDVLAHWWDQQGMAR